MVDMCVSAKYLLNCDVNYFNAIVRDAAVA